MTIQRIPHQLSIPLSSVVRAGGFAYLSGVVALDETGKVIDGDIRVQTKAVLATIEKTLQDCGLSTRDVVRTSVWLSDLNDSPAFNELYGKFFEGALPARSAVQARLYGGALVEIEVQAWAGSKP